MKIYQFCQGKWGSGDQVWVALAEDGTFIKSHISSSRAWGISDTGPQGLGRSVYEQRYGPEFDRELTFIVCPEGEGPPDDVLARHRAKQEA